MSPSSSARGVASARSGAPAPRLELADEVAQVSGNVLAAVPAEIVRGDVRMAVTWRAFMADGRYVDNDIVGLRFGGDPTKWAFMDAGGGHKLRNAARVTELLGGEDWTVARSCGLSLSDLPTAIPQLARAFDDARRVNDPDAALAVYVAFTGAFSFDVVAFGPEIPNWLTRRVFVGSRWACDEPRGACTVETVDVDYDEPERDGSTRTKTVEAMRADAPLERCGRGWVVGKLRPAT